MVDIVSIVIVTCFVVFVVDTLALNGLIEEILWGCLCFLWDKASLLYWLAYKEIFIYLIYRRYKKSIEWRGQSFTTFKFQRQERIERGRE